MFYVDTVLTVLTYQNKTKFKVSFLTIQLKVGKYNDAERDSMPSCFTCDIKYLTIYVRIAEIALLDL